MKQDKRFNYKEAEESGKKFVRYKDGCKVYGMGISKFQEIAKKANAVYKVNQEAAEKSTVYLIGILILALKMALYQFFKFKSL